MLLAALLSVLLGNEEVALEPNTTHSEILLELSPTVITTYQLLQLTVIDLH